MDIRYGPDILFILHGFSKVKMRDKDATPIETVYHLAEIARQNLKYVYVGNC